MQFPVHTTTTAPEGSRSVLIAIQQRYGFVPNLAGAFAESPAAFQGLLAQMQAYDDPAMTLRPIERQLVALAASARNGCDYCSAAHGMLAHSLGLGREQIARVQQGLPLDDARLEALRGFVDEVVERRGLIDEAALSRFREAGYAPAQVYEVLLGVALKTLTNYANHIAAVPVNSEFADFLPKRREAA